MEWNSKSFSQWDWEHLLLNAKTAENPKIRPVDWSGKAHREIDAGLFSPSCGIDSSGSELQHVSSSRGSKSVSVNSSSNGYSRTSVLTFEGSQEYSNGKKERSKEEPFGNSPTLEPSSISGEPLHSLKLGQRLYFEDVCVGSDTKNTSHSGVPMPSLSTGKKCKPNSQRSQPPLCQVEGCNLDLSSAKDYHRKHRVCESHSKSPNVVVASKERRFCQQCSRFHGLSEFDGKKRSCRRRLSDHNARRRKPHPEAVQLNASFLSSSPYGIEDFITSSDLHAPQDFHRALSLLSTTTSWGPYGTKFASQEHSNHLTHTNTTQGATLSTIQCLPHASTDYWQTCQQPGDSHMGVSYSDCKNDSHYEDFQLLKVPYESDICNRLD